MCGEPLSMGPCSAEYVRTFFNPGLTPEAGGQGAAAQVTVTIPLQLSAQADLPLSFAVVIMTGYCVTSVLWLDVTILSVIILIIFTITHSHGSAKVF